MLVTITFEIDDNSEDFGEAVGPSNSLHEALCQAIHEGNDDAIEWLMDNVENVESDS